MSAILIIAGIVALIFIIRAINKGGQNQNESKLESLLAKMHKEIFPNGQKDIDEGADKLLDL